MEKFISMLTTLSIKIYVIASSPDMFVFALNVILQKLYDWCCLNRLIPPPPPGRTEYMMSVHPIKSTRRLGNEINSDLNWNVHVKEFISPFHKNWIFLDICISYQVILLSVTYGLVVFLRQIGLWWAEEDTRTCLKDHLWPGLVQTQRLGLSPKQVAHC